MKRKMKKLSILGIIMGVLLSIAGLVVAILSYNNTDEFIKFGADYYTESYHAMAVTANNTSMVGVALGLIMIAAGIIVSLAFGMKMLKLNEEIAKPYCQGTSKTNMSYNQPQNVSSHVSTQQTNSVSSSSTNEADKYEELLKYKELLDMGSISQEEFEAKKKQLL